MPWNLSEDLNSYRTGHGLWRMSGN